MKRRAAQVLTERERDRKAYDLARAYLLRYGAEGITGELLEYYLRPERNGRTPSTLAEVFHRLLLSARNRNMMATVVPASIVNSLGPMLAGFDPARTMERFTSSDHLLDTIIAELRPSGQVRRSRAGLWPLFARATLSGARFLSQFKDGPEFLAWIQTFDHDPRKRAALPMLLSKEIDGFGFALACDFLKELGFINFAKPDVHVNKIVKGLGLCSDSATDYMVFKVVARIADHCAKSSYDVDKLFWLVGSGRFYDHPQIGRNGRIGTDRDRFIRTASRQLGQPMLS